MIGEGSIEVTCSNAITTLAGQPAQKQAVRTTYTTGFNFLSVLLTLHLRLTTTILQTIHAISMAPSQPNVPDVRHVPTLEGMPRELGMQIVSHVPHEYCRKDDSENKEKADKNKDNADEKKDEADKKYDYFDRSSGLLAIKALSLTCKNLSPLTDEWRLAHLRLETDDPEVLSQRSGRLLKMLEHLGDKVNLIKCVSSAVYLWKLLTSATQVIHLDHEKQSRGVTIFQGHIAPRNLRQPCSSPFQPSFSEEACL
jgi:hypothetical protein